ncbi:unnamed protein product [Musa banksii]
MIASANGEVVIINDGATILNKMEVLQPAAKMLVDLSRYQDAAAGDGTTTVVVLAGSLLRRSLSVLSAGVHPTAVSDALHRLSLRAIDVLHGMAIPLDLSDRDALAKSAATSLNSKVSHSAGGPTRVENAKIVVSQFQISPPKADIEQSIVVSDYTQMDRILREERNYILGMVKKIKATGCNVLPIQKSILRDAVTDLSLHYLAKAKILVIKDI